MKHKLAYMIMASAMALALCTGCKDDDEQLAAQVTLAYDLTLPVESGSDMTRAGDPGIAEFFERPQQLYLFIAAGDPKTPAENNVYFYSFPCSQSDWKRSADSLVFLGKFSKTVDWDPSLPISADLKLRAYIVASYDIITTHVSIGVNEYNRVTTPADFTESKLLDLRFYAAATDGTYRLSLRDVYSTPYNLQEGGIVKMANADADRTGYYGTVKSIAGTGNAGLITFKDTLYHTASKVDFQWNAANISQTNVMQSAIVNNAPRQGYLFRTAQTANVGGTYSKVLLANNTMTFVADDMNDYHLARYADATAVSPTSQWSGRAYTYLLPPGDLVYTLTTSEGGSTQRSVTKPAGNGTTNDIFAAWYKLDFNLLDAPAE